MVTPAISRSQSTGHFDHHVDLHNHALLVGESLRIFATFHANGAAREKQNGTQSKVGSRPFATSALLACNVDMELTLERVADLQCAVGVSAPLACIGLART